LHSVTERGQELERIFRRFGHIVIIGPMAHIVCWGESLLRANASN
jgi:hypothetical protein